jgi:hypothetical protein
MNEYNDIDSFEFDLGEGSRVHGGLKSIEGKQFLDIRKWYRYPNQTEFMPSKKGIMLGISDWKLIIPKIKEYLNEPI